MNNWINLKKDLKKKVLIVNKNVVINNIVVIFLLDILMNK